MAFEFEIVEVMVLIMMSVALVIFGFTMLRYKNLLKYFPGIICLWGIFFCTVFEGFTGLEGLNLYEHIFAMMTSILLVLGVVYEYYSSFMKGGEA